MNHRFATSRAMLLITQVCRGIGLLVLGWSIAACGGTPAQSAAPTAATAAQAPEAATAAPAPTAQNTTYVDVTPASVPGLTTIPAQVQYPIFVPGRVPTGLTAQAPVLGDPQHTPWVEVAYKTTAGVEALSVLNGPAGCCLDADPRKQVNAVTLSNGVTAYFLPNQPAFGGPILWWVQDTTYLALSGPSLTQPDLETMANSMVQVPNP